MRGLYFFENVKKGEVITKENVRSVRPGYGLHPKYYEQILGKTFSTDVERGQPLHINMINE